ncbi:hypothetical protein KXX47_001598 [Aspergillus fumigatus]|nr:hypothetical protein KXX47_001598 [Aspergillus fumigatus]
MAPLSLEQAQAIVDDIQATNGGLPPEEKQALSQRSLRAYKNLQTIAGRSIVHVAEDLYDTDTRFLFELIQNAEDNCYGHAVSQAEEPFLDLTLHEDHLTVDSNEDGFTENDVRAICSIHQSSKKQTGGYIGHKGIGFKSVFKVAYKVSIQSGPFSFYFEHHQGDSGLGMITPFNEEPQELPPSVNTRITLFFISISDFEARASELREIPDTMLLFLRKLQRLTVNIPSLQSQISFTRFEDKSKHLITLTKETNGEQVTKFYHLEKTTLSNLPQHLSRPGQPEVDLILAFPVQEDYSPLIQAQYVYSFLPMRDEGFNFLIQSDFITQASRQGVHRCDRNYAIREGICHLFLQAVAYFCKHTSLRYEWLQYLPGTHIRDPFWADLREMIFDCLKGSKILYSRRGILKSPTQLEHLSSQHCDRHGHPLMDDIEPEVYLAQSYDWNRHAENLMELGVKNLSYQSILDRLEPYLEGSAPRFLDSSLDDDWHARIAKLLLRALKRQPPGSSLTKRIKEMALIPTSDGSLLPACSSAVHFPDDERGIPIPEGLKDIRIVQRSVLEDKARLELLETLGVARCETRKVVKAILKQYNVLHGVTLEKSVSHLRYLFRTLEKDQPLDNRIFIMDKSEKQVYRAFVTLGAEIITDDLYFETLGEYGTKHLAQELQCGVNKQNFTGAPGSSGWKKWHRVQSDLTPRVIGTLKDMKVPCRNQSQTYLQCTYYPSKEMQRLCADATLQEIFDKFIDIPADIATDGTDGWEFLATFGVKLETEITFFWEIFDALETKANRTILTQAAFFRMYKELFILFSHDPIELKDIFTVWESVCIPERSGGILDLVSLRKCVWNGHPSLRTKHPLATHPEYSNDPHVACLFRDILSVRDADVSTYAEELQWRKDNADVGLDDLKAIYNCILQNMQNPEDGAMILSKFTEQKLVYLPAERSWVAPESCVWTDTPRIGVRYGISAMYRELESFFRGALNVQAPTAATYVEQLRGLASNEVVDIGAVKTAIHNLNALRPGSDELRALSRLRFLPVEMPDGTVEMLKPTDTFFIADRVEYLSAFRGRVPILDFSLDEARHLSPLLGRISLQNRYMSMAIMEQTDVDQPSHEHLSRETRLFRRKAKHFYRCILHYREDGRETVGQTLRQLQNAFVYESAGFRKTLVLQLNEATARVQSDTGSVHITDVNDVLHIYIPRDQNARQCCYSYDLPQALGHYYGLQRDPAVPMSFAVVFLTPEDFIDECLDRHGIVRVPPDIAILPESEATDMTISPSRIEEQDVVSASDEGRESGDDFLYTPRDSSRSSPGDSIDVPRTIVAHNRISAPPPRLLTVPSPDWPSPDEAPRPFSERHSYIQLLDKIIRLARPLTLAEALQRPMTTVFELLSSDLPGFSRDNWRSTIRRHISVHPDYYDLTPWSGVETADVVYRDISSALTTTLIDAGCLSHARWHGSNPTYYIEVKTTTGECGSAFFMSKSQYRRMQAMWTDRNVELEEPEIYVVFRVYYLGKENMGLKVYVDPERLRQEERLIFSPESYSVYPSLVA